MVEGLFCCCCSANFSIKRLLHLLTLLVDNLKLNQVPGQRSFNDNVENTGRGAGTVILNVTNHTLYCNCTYKYGIMPLNSEKVLKMS